MKATHQAHVVRVFTTEGLYYQHMKGYLETMTDINAGMLKFICEHGKGKTSVLPYAPEELGQVIVHRRNNEELSAHIITSIKSDLEPRHAREMLADAIEGNMRSHLDKMSKEYDKCFNKLNNNEWLRTGSYLISP